MAYTSCTTKGGSRGDSGRQAFTRFELLTLIGTLGVLVMICLPVIGNQGVDSRRGRCAANLRELSAAMQMYTADYEGRFPFNGFLALDVGTNWVAANMSYDPANPRSYDPLYVRIGSLFPYSRREAIYRCPSDPTSIPVKDRHIPRTRSYSMNSWMGQGATGWLQELPGVLLRETSQVRDPGRTFTFMEEHPDSINDGAFSVSLRKGRDLRIVDYPASYHSAGAHLTFVDGHLEYWKWEDPRTVVPIEFRLRNLNIQTPNNPDLARVQDVTTYFP